MKILVLEGLDAVGKTTLSNELNINHGWVRLRAFEGNELRGKAHRLGIMANTFLDDMYIANVLVQLSKTHPEINVVLDRSVPSAFVYQNGSVKVEGIRFWHGMLMEAVGNDPANLNIVWMRASRDFLNARQPGSEMGADEYEMLDALYGVVTRTLTALGTPIQEVFVEPLSVPELVDTCTGHWDEEEEEEEEEEPPPETEPPPPPETEPPPPPETEPPPEGNMSGGNANPGKGGPNS